MHGSRRNVTLGYDVGERSLVPNGSHLFVEIFVDALNPFGTRRQFL